MTRIRFLGNSLRQLESLPSSVRRDLEWAMDELERNSEVPPEDPDRGVTTKRLEGPLHLFRIAIRRGREDPGYRATYAVEGGEVLLVRIAHRDAVTYAGLRRSVRLLQDSTPGLPEPEEPRGG